MTNDGALNSWHQGEFVLVIYQGSEELTRKISPEQADGSLDASFTKEYHFYIPFTIELWHKFDIFYTTLTKFDKIAQFWNNCDLLNITLA